MAHPNILSQAAAPRQAVQSRKLRGVGKPIKDQCLQAGYALSQRCDFPSKRADFPSKHADFFPDVLNVLTHIAAKPYDFRPNICNFGVHFFAKAPDLRPDASYLRPDASYLRPDASYLRSDLYPDVRNFLPDEGKICLHAFTKASDLPIEEP